MFVRCSLSVCSSSNNFWLRFTKGKCVLEHAFPPCVFDQKYQFWASFSMFWDTYFAPSALSWKDRRSKKRSKTLKSDHIFCSFRFELKGSGVQKVVQNTKIGPHILQLPLWVERIGGPKKWTKTEPDWLIRWPLRGHPPLGVYSSKIIILNINYKMTLYLYHYSWYALWILDRENRSCRS